MLDRGLDDLVAGGLDPLADTDSGTGISVKRLAEGLVVEDDLDPPEHVDVAGEQSRLSRPGAEVG